MTKLQRAINALSDIFGWIALAFLFFLMIGTTTDVIWRSLTGRSIEGVFELSEASMVMVVAFGLGWAKLDDAHIRVTLLCDRAPAGIRRLLDCVSWSIAAVVLFILAWPATEEAARSFSIREFRWGYAEFPIWWVKICLAIGLWFAFVQIVTHVLAVLLNPEQLRSEEMLQGPDRVLKRF